jgi:phosphate transport system substrate-binding protein
VNTKIRRRSALVAGVAALALIAAACGDDDDSSSGASTAAPATTASGATTTSAGGATTTAGGATTTSGGSAGGGMEADCKDASGTLNASGATFPQAFYESAIEGFKEEVPGVTINYGGGGSGKGRQDLADQVTDFSGTDGVIKAEDLAKYKGGEVLYFPTVLAPITLSYNLSGVDSLELTPEQVAKIFELQTKNWKEVDPSLPDQAITVAVRSDGSGTTENFTKFLEAAQGKDAGGAWTLGAGSTVQWPAGVSAAQGNQGVSQTVKSTNGAIGYVDLSDAKASGLSFAKVQNSNDEFVEPTLEATSTAADGAEVKPDLTFFTGWSEAKGAYPIAAQTWIIAYADQTDKAKGTALKCFLQYIYSDGQTMAPDVDYAPLPSSLVEKATAQLDSKLQIPA